MRIGDIPAPVDIDQVIQLCSGQLPKVGKVEFKNRPFAPPVSLMNRRIQDISQASPGNDVLR